MCCTISVDYNDMRYNCFFFIRNMGLELVLVFLKFLPLS